MKTPREVKGGAFKIYVHTYVLFNKLRNVSECTKKKMKYSVVWAILDGFFNPETEGICFQLALI